MNFDTWSERQGKNLETWFDNDYVDNDLADEIAGLADDGRHALIAIDEAVAAYEAGAANAGDPDAVVSEIKAILEGRDPTPDLVRESVERGLAQSAAGDVVDLGDFSQYAEDPNPLDRKVRDLFCAECGTHEFPFVVHDETEVCLECHNWLQENGDS